MNIRLDDYRYIIIVDKDYHTHVYNQGVFLEGLQEVSFNAEVDALPELIIKKV